MDYSLIILLGIFMIFLFIMAGIEFMLKEDGLQRGIGGSALILCGVGCFIGTLAIHSTEINKYHIERIENFEEIVLEAEHIYKKNKLEIKTKGE
jgi:hypothetical protein